MARKPLVGQSLFIIEASRSHSRQATLDRLLWTSDQTDSGTSDITQHSQETDIYATGGIRTRKLSKKAAADPCLRPRGHRDWQLNAIQITFFPVLWGAWGGVVVKALRY